MWWYDRGISEPKFWDRARLGCPGPYPRSESRPSRKFRITILISTQMICISVNIWVNPQISLMVPGEGTAKGKETRVVKETCTRARKKEGTRMIPCEPVHRTYSAWVRAFRKRLKKRPDWIYWYQAIEDRHEAKCVSGLICNSCT